MNKATKFNGLVDDLRSRLSYGNIDFIRVEYHHFASGNILELVTNKDALTVRQMEEIRKGIGECGMGVDRASGCLTIYKMI